MNSETLHRQPNLSAESTPDGSWIGRPQDWLRRIRNWLWGYDFFISHHWASGGAYAVALAQRLRDARYDVFLDRAEYAMGDDWVAEGRRALGNTKRLVLVATREAVCESEPVFKEVTVFMARSRLIIPILFEEEMTTAERAASRTLRLVPSTVLHVSESKNHQHRGPSEEVIGRLVHTHGVLRRRSVRAIVIGTAFALLSVAALVTAWQRWEAVVSRDNLAKQLAASHHDKAHEASQPGKDLRVALLHAIQAAEVAPRSDPRREAYFERVCFLAARLPNRIVNLEGLSRELVRGVISPDLRFVAAVTSGYSVQAWDLRSGRQLRVPCAGDIAGFTGDNGAGDERLRGMESLRISPNSRLALVLLKGESHLVARLCIWELETGNAVHEQALPDNEWTVAFRRDGRAVLQQATYPQDRATARAANTNWHVVWQAHAPAGDTVEPLPVADPVGAAEKRVLIG